MRDIYNLIGRTDFRGLSDDDLMDAAEIYDSAAVAVNNALRLIGNLMLEAELNEGYSGEEAKRDLLLAGSVLRHLPRLYQALSLNAEYVRDAQASCKGKGGDK